LKVSRAMQAVLLLGVLDGRNLKGAAAAAVIGLEAHTFTHC
jgi:hypothetical protein